MNEAHYLNLWHLSHARKIAETPTSHVFVVTFRGSSAVLKIFTGLGQEDESGGSIALQRYNGNGAVRLLISDSGAQLLSYADGQSLRGLVSEGRDTDATQVICTVIEKLHNCPDKSADGLKSLSMHFRSLFMAATLKNADPIFVEAAALMSELLDSARESVVLHGDVHHENIIHSSTDGWIAIDPKGLFGERTYDFANVFYNPDDMPGLVEDRARISSISLTFSKFFKIDQARVLKFAFVYGCLSASWAFEDGGDPTNRLRVAKIIRSMI